MQGCALTGNVTAAYECTHVHTLVVEDDPETGVYYVGRGCYPNKEGVVQLDAALMRGEDCSFGAVAGLERYTYWGGLACAQASPLNL